MAVEQQHEEPSWPASMKAHESQWVRFIYVAFTTYRVTPPREPRKGKPNLAARATVGWTSEQDARLAVIYEPGTTWIQVAIEEFKKSPTNIRRRVKLLSEAKQRGEILTTKGDQNGK